MANDVFYKVFVDKDSNRIAIRRKTDESDDYDFFDKKAAFDLVKCLLKGIIMSKRH